jgi:hypothetical protein
VRVEQLPVSVHQGQDEDAERDHREPVRHSDDRQPRHPRVAEELADDGPGSRLVAARLGLAQLDGPHDLGDGPREERDGDDRHDQADDDGGDPHVGVLSCRGRDGRCVGPTPR